MLRERKFLDFFYFISFLFFSLLFFSFLFYSILFISILFYSILFFSFLPNLLTWTQKDKIVKMVVIIWNRIESTVNRMIKKTVKMIIIRNRTEHIVLKNKSERTEILKIIVPYLPSQFLFFKWEELMWKACWTLATWRETL